MRLVRHDRRTTARAWALPSPRECAESPDRSLHSPPPYVVGAISYRSNLLVATSAFFNSRERLRRRSSPLRTVGYGLLPCRPSQTIRLNLFGLTLSSRVKSRSFVFSAQ